MAIWNVYRWERMPGPSHRAVRVWQGAARHAPGAEVEARAARPELRRQRLIARRADNDPYADDPRTKIEGGV